MKSHALVVSISLFLLTNACRERSSEADVLAAGVDLTEQIAGNPIQDIRLGDAHLSKGGQTFTPCIKINKEDIIVDPPKSSEFSLVFNANSEILRSNLAASVDGQMSITGESSAPMKIHGAMNFISAAQGSEYQTSLVVIFKVSDGKAYLAPHNNYKLTPAGEAAITDPSQQLKTCGDAVVSELKMGAALAMRMTLKFNSISEKRLFMANGGFDNLGTASTKTTEPGASSAIQGQIEGSFSTLTKGLKSNASLEIQVTQFGGLGAQVGEAINEEIATCNAQNQKPCWDQVKKFIQYASNKETGWPSQFKVNNVSTANSQDDYTRYYFTGVSFKRNQDFYSGFMSTDPSEADAVLYRAVRMTMMDYLIRENVNLLRVKQVLDFQNIAADKSGMLDRETLEDIRVRILNKMQLAVQTYTWCRNVFNIETEMRCKGKILKGQPGYPDTEYPGAVAAFTQMSANPALAYNEASLNIIPSNYREYCINYNSWNKAANSGNLTNSDELLVIESMMPGELRDSFTTLINQCQFMNAAASTCQLDSTNYPSRVKFDTADSGLKCSQEEKKSAAVMSNIVARTPGIGTVSSEAADAIPLDTLDPLVIFRQLTRLEVPKSELKSLEPIRLSPLLETFIWDNGILDLEALKDISALGTLKNISLRKTLSSIKYGNNFIDAAPYLKQLNNVRTLDVGNNEYLTAIGEIEAPKLEYLNIENTGAVTDPATCQAQLTALKAKSPKLTSVYFGNSCDGVEILGITRAQSPRKL